MSHAERRRKEGDDEKAGCTGYAVTIECNSLGMKSSRANLPVVLYMSANEKGSPPFLVFSLPTNQYLRVTPRISRNRASDLNELSFGNEPFLDSNYRSSQNSLVHVNLDIVKYISMKYQNIERCVRFSSIKCWICVP